MLLGWHTRGLTHYDYRTLTLSGRPSQGVHLHARTSRQQPVETVMRTPTTPMMQPSTGITHHRFSLFRFRSPLLTESFLFSLPEGTEMFHFPSFPPTSLYIQLVVTNHDGLLGSPIRTSWDQGPVIGFPRLFADSHVLHRLLVPRHPPCALNNLHTDKIKDINLD